MSIEALLEVAIGLIFVWLALSMAAMYAQDWIVTRFKWRSSMLESSIRNLLENDDELTTAFYSHPLIKSLCSGKKDAKFLDKLQLPSYIPASQFALTLFDIVISAGTDASVIQKHMASLRSIESEINKLGQDKQALAKQELDLVLDLARQALDSESGAEVAAALTESLKERLVQMAVKVPELKPIIEEQLKNIVLDNKTISSAIEQVQEQFKDGAPEKNTLQKIHTGLAVLGAQHPDVQVALKTLLTGVEEYATEGESALARARTHVENWFDNSMDRLSGWYKRRMQVLSLVVGIALAVILNADTLQLATYLWRDPAMRQALVAQAEIFMQDNEQGIGVTDSAQLYGLQLEFSQLNIPIGWTGTPLLATSSGGVPQADGTEKRCTLSPSSTVDLYGFRAGGKCYPIINAPSDLTGWFIKIVGLGITGLATAQGAPFWFDVLKKLINLRTSGANPSEKK